jgi:D-methionine transport system permease protein
MSHDTITLIYKLIPIELWNTFYMVLVSSAIAVLFGGGVGLSLVITSKGHLVENKVVHHIIGCIMNTARSIPFVILLVALIPITRLIIGTSLGTTAAIVPLTIAAIPFFSRIVETALLEVDRGIIDAAKTIGSSAPQIIFKVLIWEALPSLILGITTLVINIIGYSTMAGAIGGGGLGKVAIQYGYQRFDWALIAVTLLLLTCLVQATQFIGATIASKIQKQRG